MREHVQTSWKFDLRPELLLPPPPPSHKQGEDPESMRLFEERGPDVLSADGCKLAPRANILYLQLDFGAVFIVWKRLSALGSELKATLHFPLPQMMSATSCTSGVLGTAQNVSGDLLQLLFFVF